MSRDLVKAVRYEGGKEQARVYLTYHIGWPDEQFDQVDWDRLRLAEESRTATRRSLRNNTWDTAGEQESKRGIIHETIMGTWDVKTFKIKRH